jgi:hypothetical protein
MVCPLGKLVMALGTLALLAPPTWAQQQKGRGFGPGMGGGGMILRAENVQKDLKLSGEQIGKIDTTLRSVQEKHRDDFAALSDLGPQERMPKMISLNKAVADDVKKGLSMTSKQAKRYDQISLQQRGLMAFADPTVVEKLNLTRDQRSQIREIASAGGTGRGLDALKNASAEEKKDAFRKMRERQRENMKKVMAVLSDDQKKEWKELTGEPIEIQFASGGRRQNN